MSGEEEEQKRSSHPLMQTAALVTQNVMATVDPTGRHDGQAWEINDFWFPVHANKEDRELLFDGNLQLKKLLKDVISYLYLDDTEEVRYCDVKAEHLSCMIFLQNKIHRELMYKNQLQYFFANIGNPHLINNVFEAGNLLQKIVEFKNG